MTIDDHAETVISLDTHPANGFSYASKETHGLVRVPGDPRLHRVVFIPDKVLLHPLTDTEMPDSDDDFEAGTVSIGGHLTVDATRYVIASRPHNCPVLIKDDE